MEPNQDGYGGDALLPPSVGVNRPIKRTDCIRGSGSKEGQTVKIIMNIQSIQAPEPRLRNASERVCI